MSYDPEKEKLVKIAKNSKYDGPTETIRIESVSFDENTRKCQIFYTLIKGKKTIDKRFSYNGIQYKIYSDWKYTENQKKTTITLTDDVIETLLSSKDEIIKISLDKILNALPYDLKPAWFLKNEVSKKYNEIRASAKTRLENKYDIKKLSFARNSKEKTYAELNTEINSLQKELDYLSESNNNYNKKIYDIEKGFLSRLFLKKTVAEYKERIITNNNRFREIQELLLQKNTQLEQIKKDIALIKTNLSMADRDYKAELNQVHDKIAQNEKDELNSIQSLSERRPKNSSNTGSQKGVPTYWVKEERAKMGRIYQDGKTLRDWILFRDNYTCRKCGNSTKKEPNLLLEVDHIQPVSKWGPSIPENLQTLCWKCNREKSNKEN